MRGAACKELVCHCAARDPSCLALALSVRQRSTTKDIGQFKHHPALSHTVAEISRDPSCVAGDRTLYHFDVSAYDHSKGAQLTGCTSRTRPCLSLSTKLGRDILDTILLSERPLPLLHLNTKPQRHNPLRSPLKQNGSESQ